MAALHQNKACLALMCLLLGAGSAAASWMHSATLTSGFTMEWNATASELHALVKLNAQAWSSVGFSASSSGGMVPAVSVGASGGTTVQLHDLTAKTGPGTGVASSQATLTVVSATSSGGSSSYEFKLTSSTPNLKLAVGAVTKVIWARGSSNTWAYHTARGKADVRFNPTSGQPTHQDTDETNPIIVFHGVLMLMAWGLILPMGAFFAHFFKDKPDNWWFRTHRQFQVIGFVMTLVAFALAIGGTAMDGNPHFDSPHKILGLVVTILAIMQVVGAATRPPPEPKTCKRKMFEWGHARIVGYGVLFFGYINSSFGIWILQADDILKSMLYVILVLCIALIIGLAVWAACCRKKSTSVSPDNASGVEMTDPQGP